MDYQQTVDYLFARLPMYSRIGAAALRNNLDNINALCAFLGDPQRGFKSIHVAGTNGKGSVTHMLAAVFQSSGYKTGLYTSPHLHDFRERIRINGAWIEEDFVVDFVSRIAPMIDETDPSFFEISVAMAFEYFRQNAVDIAMIEVGLGGRLDSTNIILPELSVITNVDYDHMNLLGDTLNKIAAEKAGIIKQHIPVIVGETNPQTKPVFESIADRLQSPITFADNHFYVSEWTHKENVLAVTVVHPNDEHVDYRLDLTGYYQLKNLVTTLETIRQAEHKGWQLPREKISAGLSHVRKLTALHGRWETIHHDPLVVLDVAHNEAGMRELAAQVELTDHYNLHVVIGAVKDKAVEKILALLPKEAFYYYTRAQIPRALPENELAAIGASLGLKGTAYATVAEALQSALAHAGRKDMILVCGSVFTVAEVDLSLIHT